MLVLIVAHAIAALQMPTVEVGEVDLYGQTGLDEKAVRASFTVHVGDKFSFDQWPGITSRMAESIKRQLGKPPTDVNLVAYDIHGKVMIFVGLPGPTIKQIALRAAPTGLAKLPDEAYQLYKTDMDRLFKATDFREDQSKGYALSYDPVMHAAQLKMREFTPKHEDLVVNVLETSKFVDQRQAAATLLGYANRSRAQIDVLSAAALDPDETVRNNAVRALALIAMADPPAGKMYPAKQFITMLSSGVWTDRNKSGAVVEALSRSRDPKLLAQIRSAIPSLIEMAHWTNPPHAASARTILGRVAGIEEKKLVDMVNKGDVDGILAALTA